MHCGIFAPVLWRKNLDQADTFGKVSGFQLFAKIVEAFSVTINTYFLIAVIK